MNPDDEHKKATIDELAEALDGMNGEDVPDMGWRDGAEPEEQEEGK